MKETIQTRVMTTPVLCLVTRARSGYIMAMKRSHEIADSVRTDDVKHVTKKKTHNVQINLN